MLPPRCTVRPACCSMAAIRLVVVVLPSEPVTATRMQGHSWKNSSISLVTVLPAAMACCKAGV